MYTAYSTLSHDWLIVRCMCRQVGKRTSPAVTSLPAVREANDRASVDATWQCVLTMDNGVAARPPRYASAPVNFI